jgi:uroporphyrinogen-III synthase
MALEGCRIVLTADRRTAEITAAFERHGASVMKAPALTIVPHADDETLVARTRDLIANPPDVIVATTGIGFRAWMEVADEAGLAPDLERVLEGARIIARGAKARGAVQQAGFAVAWVPGTETAAELGERLVDEGVTGCRVAVQHHGSGADGLDELFLAHGAAVVSLTVYRWGPPADPQAVRASALAAAAGSVDAVVFTSGPAAHEWIQSARECGALDRIRARAERGELMMAAVGPATAEPLREQSVAAFIAERGRLGSLIRGVVARLGAGSPSVSTAAGALSLRSAGAVIDGRLVPLSPSGVAVLRVLFDARGAVVSRRTLLDAIPASAPNAHALEMTIARLREALGAAKLIHTVVKRGYRLDVQEEP